MAALVESKLERAKNYAEQGNRYWNELTKGMDQHTLLYTGHSLYLMC